MNKKIKINIICRANFFHFDFSDFFGCRHANVRDVPDWAAVRRNLYKIRSEAMPPSPKTPAEIVAAYEIENIMKNYGMTAAAGGVEATAFYRKTYSNPQFAYCIFASEYIAERVAELEPNRRHFFMDGTFRVVPYGDFSQLLVIHAAFFDKTIPFIYVLMTRKTQAAYTHLFRCIDDEILPLNPSSFMTDYEVAMRNALGTVYPEAQMYGCWFHFCQAVKRHASQIGGFLVAARSNNESAEIYYDLLCLPLLPPQYIINVFNLIKMESKNKHGDDVGRY